MFAKRPYLLRPFCVIFYKKLHNKNFYRQNPFASVLFCELAYRANITWAAEPALLLVLLSTVDHLAGDLPGDLSIRWAKAGFAI